MAKHTNDIRVTMEMGPKGKKVVAVAADWPGLERGATTWEATIERLLSYVPRYAPVAKLARMEAAFATGTTSTTSSVDVVEQYPGTGSTDFWGISFAFSDIDRQAMSGEELEGELKLMRACWVFFDDVRSRVSAEMQNAHEVEGEIGTGSSAIQSSQSRTGRRSSACSYRKARCRPTRN